MSSPQQQSGIYKFITIRQASGMFSCGKPVFEIVTNRSHEQIGLLSYHKPWKQYVFSTDHDCVFNNSCLRDIIDFMENHIYE